MDCDDDGFMNNALSICKALGYTKAVLDELLKKRFLLDMDDGVTVIKHFRVNNYIPKDRKKDTIYQDKLAMLKVKDDGSYTVCIQNVGSLYTQVSIGKDSIGKVREEDIKTIMRRYLEMGYPSDLIDQALTIYDKDGYPKTPQFFQDILNTLTDDEIYNKEGYIYQIARNKA